MKLIDRIIAYETGELPAGETLTLFSDLIKTGQAWTLQGHYGRTAEALIKGGYINRQGDILKEVN
jgi:hypothetical protein